jgi:hypothetical protein
MIFLDMSHETGWRKHVCSELSALLLQHEARSFDSLFLFFFSSSSRIRLLASSVFYKFHLLHGLLGSLLLLGLYQGVCFGTRFSSIISACSSRSCLYILTVSFAENTRKHFLLSAFLILSTLVFPFANLRNRISAVYNFCACLSLIVQHPLA